MENAVLAGMFSVLSGILAQPDSKERTAALLILGAAFAEVGAPPGFILALQEAGCRMKLGQPAGQHILGSFKQGIVSVRL